MCSSMYLVNVNAGNAKEALHPLTDPCECGLAYSANIYIFFFFEDMRL